MATITSQPTYHDAPSAESLKHLDKGEDGGAHLPTLAQIKRKLTTKDGWIGSYGKLSFFVE